MPDDDLTDDDEATTATTRELVRKGMIRLERNADDEIDHDELVRFVAARIPFDEQAERERKARNAIKRERASGSTPADGQLHFDGIDPYDYEPDRLVMSGDGGLVENHRSKPSAKQAEARRDMKNAVDAMRQAERRQAESSHYADWATTQIRAGVEWTDITFGRFVQSQRTAS